MNTKLNQTLQFHFVAFFTHFEIVSRIYRTVVYNNTHEKNFSCCFRLQTKCNIRYLFISIKLE